MMHITDSLAGLDTNSPILPAVLSPAVLSLPCPGVAVPWTAGSLWGDYPYYLHDVQDVGWEPFSFNSTDNTIYFRADKCEARETGSNGVTCMPCQHLPNSPAFIKLQTRAIEAKERTPWHYLTTRQHLALASKLTKQCKDLRTKLSNSSKANARLRQHNNDYRRIMILLSNNELPGLRRILVAKLKSGASSQMILATLERVIKAKLRARGGYNKRELDVSFP
ncbi:hypothetical protein DFH07DRAFT_588613 [Mycena maculata]|uniref:Uncharacterized protein n=1 Tax=Mycena maculata TaxID=230809 RepID=A0AAD7IQ65_9AGAR|nr:hypothetical protein DFH07DRAFT_588613 [Mycena maculata]